MNQIPSLSFCITCMNRLYQIRDTLGQNLHDNRMFDFLVEFVLIDFGSTDGLRDWVYQNYLDDIKSGYLKYYYTEELKCWHASIAKNTAHLYANNDILVNLDCDNYTGHNGGKFIIKEFMKYNSDIVLHQRSKDPSDGSYGRIGMRKDFFYQIGGYDESFEPMGHEDTNLFRRLQALGLMYILVPDPENIYNKAIMNSKAESIINTGSSLQWEQMQQANVRTSERNLAEGRLVANNGKFGIRNRVFNIFGQEFSKL